MFEPKGVGFGSLSPGLGRRVARTPLNPWLAQQALRAPAIAFAIAIATPRATPGARELLPRATPGATSRELHPTTPEQKTGSYSRSVVVALEGNLSRYGCGQCSWTATATPRATPGLLHRELLPVNCTESYSIPVCYTESFSRSATPRATPGLLHRELLPVCNAKKTKTHSRTNHHANCDNFKHHATATPRATPGQLHRELLPVY